MDNKAASVPAHLHDTVSRTTAPCRVEFIYHLHKDGENLLMVIDGDDCLPENVRAICRMPFVVSIGITAVFDPSSNRLHTAPCHTLLQSTPFTGRLVCCDRPA